MLPRRGLSVRPSVCVRLTHSWIVLKPLDGMRCHLAGTLVWSQVEIVLYRRLGLSREIGDLGSEPLQSKFALFSE